MDPRIGTVMDEWRSRACDPGYAGLQQLADDGFSGAVTADGARGFMVNGRLVGIDGGTIESFWGSDFTAAEAEDPALPLLCGMWLADHAVEAEYYTGETSIAEVNTTLTQGNFTGFVELSENVFSGDYYIVYYGGASFSVAFIGTEDRVVTGEEAFDRADEEVGIYEVNSADIEVIDIPDPEVDDSLPSDAADDSPEKPGPDDEEEPEPVAAPAGEADDEPVVKADVETAATAGTESHVDAGQTAEAAVAEEPNRDQAPDAADRSAAESARQGGEADLASLAAAAEDADADDAAPMTIEDAEAVDGDLEVIPSLDPQRSTLPPGHDDAGGTPTPQETGSRSSDDSAQSIPADTPSSVATDDRIDDLEAELAETREARDELAVENDRLSERVAHLEGELEALQSELAAATSGADESGLAAAEAIAGTNLFVRYQSKADFTLDDAIEGGGDQAEVAQNLQLEWHTDFEVADLTIEDEPFESFLEGTTHYRFASWLVSELLFELRDTGGDKGLVQLYEAIPEIDRIEFDGEVPIQTTDGGERGSSVYAFDVVCRNSMGDPLLLADLNASREPVGGEIVSELVTNAHEVANARASVVTAAYVTNSFYEPDALEAVTSATESGFLRGGAKDSYVRVTRKRGFHLCLVESRDESFHLTVPEL